MHTYGFEKLEIWQLSRLLVKNVYEATQTFPADEKYGLTSQLRRASVSISSNIAEGVGRSTQKERARFIEIAYSSLMEVLNQLILSNDLAFLTGEQLNKFRNDINELSNKLNAYRNYLFGK